ncbi:hypothetical protein [Streptomyces sp. NPDC049906]|uniref:hypothetical protein n=1 Tax=Streptomyces sp. NPDC049906 TaxID=3155656 RepID=UPI00341F986F
MPELADRLLDYWVAGYRPADELVGDDFDFVAMAGEDFTFLAGHHTERDSFFLFHNRAAVWDGPETPPFVALHITRDPDARTFRFGASGHPLVPLAQGWLIGRGCPPEDTVVSNADGPRPADTLTTSLETWLRTNPGGRYEVLEHHNRTWESWTLIRDSHPDAAKAPYRLFLDKVSRPSHTYTLREGAFPTPEEAADWLADPSLPFPYASAPAGVRAEAALTRSPQPQSRYAAPPDPVVEPRPTAPTATARPGRGRS